MERRESAVAGEGEPLRADRFIAERMGCLSRSQVKGRGARIAVNGKEVKPSFEVSPGDRVEVSWTEEAAPALKPEEIPLEILFENDDVVVVNKAAGMVTHPASGHWSGTLVNALLPRLRLDDFPGYGGRPSRDPSAAYRPGIVHRLDRDTSGVLIVAKNAAALEFLASQFRDRSARKQYLAIVRGRPPAAEGRIEGSLGRDPSDRKRFAVVPSGGRRSLTLYRLAESLGAYSLLSLFPRTGRTHQLRVHLKSIGCPILGDPLYGGGDRRFPGAGLMLHAYRLRIVLPGEQQPREFRAPIPPAFSEALRSLRTREGTHPRGHKKAAP